MYLSPARRIALNVIATYGRSLFALVCGLFTSRWVLMSLGEVDFGLYGVVGGLSAFVAFINGLLATAVGRFYAYAVGEANKPGNAEAGLVECRRWFTTAVTLHTVIPTVLFVVGYPLGVWAVESFLTIPPDRVPACLWVWRCVCVTCFVGMLNVPYQAMYTAKQNIAELTIYSFVTTTLNVCVLYYMVTHPADWLTRYAAWMMLVSVIPQLIIGIRAHIVYPECRFRREAFLDRKYLRPILSFVGFRLLNGASMVATNEGQAVVVNKYLGPSANAAMTVGNQVSCQCQSLAAAFAGALYPAITNAAGEGKLDEMRTLALRASKYASLSMLLFVIPLSLEIGPVLDIWLKTPPAGAAGLCVLVLVSAVLERLTEGHWMAVFAVGRIARYQVSVSLLGFLVLGMGWALVAFGGGLSSVGWALVAGKALAQFYRLHYGRTVAGIPVRKWARDVLVPLVTTIALSLAAGASVTLVLEPSFARIVLTTAACTCVMVCCAGLLVLTADERACVRKTLEKRLPWLFDWLHRLWDVLLVERARWFHARNWWRLRRKWRRGSRIRVLFIESETAKWKSQTLYDALKADPRFEPLVGVSFRNQERDYPGRVQVAHQLEDRQFFEKAGCRCVDIYEASSGRFLDVRELQPDVIFYQQPWYPECVHSIRRTLRFALPMYVSYYVPNYENLELECRQLFHRLLACNFVLNEPLAERYRRLSPKSFFSGRFVATGHPMLDLLAESHPTCPGRRTVVYAPHFTFDHPNNPVAIHYGTILEVGRYLLDYARRHPEVDWIFKPHPSLYRALVDSGAWTKEDADSYYAAWAKIGTVCTTGDYMGLFVSSSLMVTDCGSFMTEYGATGHPVISLLNRWKSRLEVGALKPLYDTYYAAHSRDELAAHLRTLVEEERDPLRPTRLRELERLHLVGVKAGKNILDYLVRQMGGC